MNNLELQAKTTMNLKNIILSRKRQVTEKYLYYDCISINRGQNDTIILFRNAYLCRKPLKKRKK